MNERDTHFANASRLLWDDLSNKLEFWIETAEDDFSERRHEIIAQFLYDFAVYVVGGTIGTSDVSHIPDLTAWPNTSQPEP